MDLQCHLQKRLNTVDSTMHFNNAATGELEAAVFRVSYVHTGRLCYYIFKKMVECLQNAVSILKVLLVRLLREWSVVSHFVFFNYINWRAHLFQKSI